MPTGTRPPASSHVARNAAAIGDEHGRAGGDRTASAATIERCPLREKAAVDQHEVIQRFMDEVVGPWATQARIGALIHSDYEEDKAAKLETSYVPVDFSKGRAHGATGSQIGIPGVGYLPSTRIEGAKDEHGNARQHVISRGVVEVEEHEGKPYVRLYSTMYRPEAAGADGETEYKDVHQDPRTGKITITTGKHGTVFWVSGGQPLRQIKWVDNYKLRKPVKGQPFVPAKPVIRSFLVPMDVYNQVSKDAITEDMAGEEQEKHKDRALNVDVHNASDQLGLRGKSLETVRDSARPYSLVSYAEDESDVSPGTGGTPMTMSKLRVDLGVPTKEPRKRDGWVNPTTGKFEQASGASKKADEMARAYGLWTKNDAFLTDGEKNIPVEGRKSILTRFLKDRDLELPPTWEPLPPTRDAKPSGRAK